MDHKLAYGIWQATENADGPLIGIWHMAYGKLLKTFNTRNECTLPIALVVGFCRGLFSFSPSVSTDQVTRFCHRPTVRVDIVTTGYLSAVASTELETMMIPYPGASYVELFRLIQ